MRGSRDREWLKAERAANSPWADVGGSGGGVFGRRGFFGWAESSTSRQYLATVWCDTSMPAFSCSMTRMVSYEALRSRNAMMDSLTSFNARYFSGVGGV